MNGNIFEVIVIGAGPAGLMCSYYLKHLGLEHIIFDQGHLGETWRAQRWDNFRMITPFHASLPPGALLKTRLPHAFGTASDMVAILQEYASSFQLPVTEQARVLSVDKPAGSPVFQVKVLHDNELTRTYDAWQVILAVGASNRPFIPPIASSLPGSIHQLHSAAYKHADRLKPGAVLVVGSGQSGMEIAHDLVIHGRTVWWSGIPRMELPRQYRGRELAQWLTDPGLSDRFTGLSERLPVITYPLDDETVLDRSSLASRGVRMTGHLEKVKSSTLSFAAWNEADLKDAQASAASVLDAIDEHIARENTDAPGGYVATALPSLAGATDVDLAAEGITTVIWATGFDGSVDAIQCPAATADLLASERGVTALEGLYVVGSKMAGRDYVVSAKDEAGHVTNRIYGILR